MLKSLNVKTLAGLLALCLLTPAAYATDAVSPAPQSQKASTGTVIGTVTDSEGEPLVSASVLVEGTKVGTPTNIDGEFSIANVKHGAKITVSYIGCKPQTLVWTGKALNFVLQNQGSVLDEVVVMGYGVQQKRAKVTNSVAKVNEKDLTIGVNANPAQALAGAVSGVKVTINSGDPSATPSITIRGGTNWNNANNDPLIVVDGQIRSSMADINPNDIESMEVLKDAGATALYGARAANGVILISTKQGKAGEGRVNLSVKYGLTSYDTGYDMLGAADYIHWVRTATYNTCNPEV